MAYRRLYIILATLVTVLLGIINTGACGGLSGETRDWEIPQLGVVTVPHEMTTANMVEVLKQLTAKLAPPQSDKNATINPDLKQYTPAAANNLDFAIYQLTINDGEAYHQAWFFMGIEKQPSVSLRGLFGVKDQSERNAQLRQFQDKLSRGLEALQFKDAKTGFAFKFIGGPELKLVDSETSMAMLVNGRGLLSCDDFMLPFAVKSMFLLDSRFSMVLVVTSDSERLFWEDITTEMFTSLQRNRQIVFR